MEMFNTLMMRPRNEENMNDRFGIKQSKLERTSEEFIKQASASENEKKENELLAPNPESRRKELEKKLSLLLIPPPSPLRRTIWKIATLLVRAETEMVAKGQESESASRRKVESSERMLRIEKITEALLSLIVKETILPILKLTLSSEYREKLHTYGKEYAELLRLDTKESGIENSLKELDNVP